MRGQVDAGSQLDPGSQVDQCGLVAGCLAASGVAAEVVVVDGEVTATVPVADWVVAAQAARDHADLQLRFFDWLTAVDVGDGFDIFLHLMSVTSPHAVMLGTSVPRFRPEVPSLTGVFPGASWPERETCEMFGISFPGHPDPRPLLLPDTFDGYPMRKDFVLASRVVRPWPGSHDPAASAQHGARAAAGGAARTRRHRPPGVPAPGTWEQPEPPEGD